MKKFIALFILMTGAALASIPDSGGIIHGCYLTTGPPQARGALRVVDAEAGQACASGEVAISWDQQFDLSVIHRGHSLETGFNIPAAPGIYNGFRMCQSGEIVTGGGYTMIADASALNNIHLVTSRPVKIDGLDGWEVAFSSPVSESAYVAVYATCTLGTSTVSES